MATGTGTVEIDFGAWPGSNEASVSVVAEGVTAASHVEAWVMGDSTTTDHTAADHRYFPLFAALTTEPGADTFTIHARSTQKMQGKWLTHYVWAEIA
jgi:hypothetical protein